MVVFVHSLGSWWSRRDSGEGGCSIWNSTGIDDGARVRPRFSVAGQVSFGRRARIELAKRGRLRPGAWIASDLSEQNGLRQLQLIARASAGAAVDWHLVTITESLIGRIDAQEMRKADILVIAQSDHKARQETMLMLRPCASVFGDLGIATFIVSGKSSHWDVTRWSSAA
jgi:hypothetical protein